MVLQVKDLSIAYGKKVVVESVSFTLCKGETLAIVGESGSGKTTLIRSVLGSLPPSGTVVNGAIYVDGASILDLREAELRHLRGRTMSMVFQDCGNMMNPVQTVGSQFVEYLRLHEAYTKKQAVERAIELCHQVALDNGAELLSKYPFQLSGGQRQRVGIAMGLAFSPDVLLADEPTAALDVTTQREVVQQIMELQQRNGMAIVIVTHSMRIAANMADHILVMQQGRVVEQGAVEDVMNHPNHPYTQTLLRAVPVIGGRRYV